MPRKLIEKLAQEVFGAAIDNASCSADRDSAEWFEVARSTIRDQVDGGSERFSYRRGSGRIDRIKFLVEKRALEILED